MPSRRTADLLAVKELDNSKKAVAVAEECVEAARRAEVERSSRLRGRRPIHMHGVSARPTS